MNSTALLSRLGPCLLRQDEILNRRHIRGVPYFEHLYFPNEQESRRQAASLSLVHDNFWDFPDRFYSVNIKRSRTDGVRGTRSVFCSIDVVEVHEVLRGVWSRRENQLAFYR